MLSKVSYQLWKAANTHEMVKILYLNFQQEERILYDGRFYLKIFFCLSYFFSIIIRERIHTLSHSTAQNKRCLCMNIYFHHPCITLNFFSSLTSHYCTTLIITNECKTCPHKTAVSVYECAKRGKPFAICLPKNHTRH